MSITTKKPRGRPKLAKPHRPWITAMLDKYGREHIAELLGITEFAISRIEYGLTGLKDRHCIKLGELTGVHPAVVKLASGKAPKLLKELCASDPVGLWDKINKGNV
jgi:hypothetical protein